MPVTPPPASGGGGGSVVFYDEGSAIGTGTILNFVGAGVAGTFSGGTAVATISGGTAAGSIVFLDEGTVAGTATHFNVVGSSGTVAYSGGTATLTLSSGGGAAGTLPVNVASNTQTSSSDTLSVTISAAADGNVLIACIIGIGTANVSSISSTNTTWTNLATSTAGTSPKAEIWKGVVSGGVSGTTVTITYSASNSDRAAVISEWDGITGTLDQAAVRTNVTPTSQVAYSGAILPTNASALVVACFATTNGSSPYRSATGLNAFEPLVLHTGNLGGYMGAFYGFPGTVPLVVAASFTTGSYSSAIVSVT